MDESSTTAADSDDLVYVGAKGDPADDDSGQMPLSRDIIWSGQPVAVPSARMSAQARNRMSMFASSVMQFYRHVAGHGGMQMHEILGSSIGVLHPDDMDPRQGMPRVKSEPHMDPWEAAFMSLAETLGEQRGDQFSERRRMAMWLTQPEVSGVALLSETASAKTKEALACIRRESGLADITFDQVALDADIAIQTLFAQYIAHLMVRANALRPGNSGLQQTPRIHGNEAEQIKVQFRCVEFGQNRRLQLCSPAEARRRQQQRIDQVVGDFARTYRSNAPAYRVVPITAVL